jgi:hypothetical protein
MRVLNCLKKSNGKIDRCAVQIWCNLRNYFGQIKKGMCIQAQPLFVANLR